MKLPCQKCSKVGPSWCNRLDCPLFPKTSIPAKQSFSGATPNLFIGQYGYPHVNAGVLATESYTQHDDPTAWTANKTPIPQIMAYRSQLINSTTKADVAKPQDTLTDLRSLIAQATQAVAIDVELAKKPIFTIQYPQGTTPHGPSVSLKHAELTQNVHVPTDVDKTLSDDLLAAQQLSMLHKRHDEYYLQKLFSAGLLGKTKKLVPTRWTITAVDDTLGKEHLAKIRELPVMSEALVYTGGHYGNTYCILFLPHHWQYELFELYAGSQEMTQWLWTDDEPYTGRTNYAEDTAGGYYAARLGITRKLLAEKRQGAVLAFRFVTDEYTNPLGVWVVREAVRLCLANKPLRFASDNLAIAYLRAFSQKKCGIDVSAQLDKSKLLPRLRQRTLAAF